MASRKKFQAIAQSSKIVACQECAMGAVVYVPCGRPAKVMIGWKGRSDTPLPMCEMCADHNVRNRSGYLSALPLQAVDFEVFANAKPETSVLPPTNHNSNITDDALITENFKIEDLIKAAQTKFNEWAEPHKKRLTEIEAEISRRLLERNAKNTKTDSGTAYFSDLLNAKVESVEALYDYVADNWETIGDEVKINLPVDAVRTHMEANDGKPPPGMSISFYKRLNIKRS